MTEKYEVIALDGLQFKVYNFVTGEFTTEYSDDTLTDNLGGEGGANEVMHITQGYTEYAVHRVITAEDGTVKRVAIL
jgi:hypothetical protein